MDLGNEGILAPQFWQDQIILLLTLESDDSAEWR